METLILEAERDLWFLLRIAVAALLGGLVGFEREVTGKEAGLRTHMLVAIGAALAIALVEAIVMRTPTMLPSVLPAEYRLQIAPVSVIEAVMSGIGFLGAGTIFVAGVGKHVKGLTTAASIWVTAAIGLACGLERYVLAIGTTLLVLVILRVLQGLAPSKGEE
jgi:putative Mg2+ transporter-C (MgtC) family protein